MKDPDSSRKRARILFGVWGALGIALIAAAFSPQLRHLDRNQRAVESLASAQEALAQVKKLGAEAPDALFATARERAEASVALLGGAGAETAVNAQVELALVDLESGRADQALKTLSELAAADGPATGAGWTANTPLIQAALAESLYKFAMMCRKQGDGFDNWSLYAEEAAGIYRELADRSEGADREACLKNLAACTRLIHGESEGNHSLGFPARETADCPRIGRLWQRIRPDENPKPDPNDDPIEEPLKPEEPGLDSKGR